MSGNNKTPQWKQKISQGLKTYWANHKKPPKLCPVCHKQIRRYANRCKKHRIITDLHRLHLGLAGTGRKHSLETRAMYSLTRKGVEPWNKGKQGPRGPDASNWRGGITLPNKLARNTPQYIKWRQNIFIRDDYTCQDCGVRGTILHAHHIEPFKKNEILRTELSNGITLCYKCHRIRHKKTFAKHR